MAKTDAVLACVDQLVGLDYPGQLPNALAEPLNAAAGDIERLLTMYGAGPPHELPRRLAARQSLTILGNGGRLTITRAGSAFLLEGRQPRRSSTFTAFQLDLTEIAG